MYYRSRVKIMQSDTSNDSECKVCGYLARDFDDILMIKREGSCTDCRNNFKFLDQLAWNSGQRPTQEVARERLNILIEEV